MSKKEYDPVEELFGTLKFASNSTNGKQVLTKDKGIIEIIEYLDGFDTFDIDREEIPKEAVVKVNKKFFRECFRLKDVPVYKNGSVLLRSPFNINFKLVYGDNIGSLTFKRDEEKSCEYIYLGKPFIKRSIGIYAHEITHTQLEFDPTHFYKNYFDKEVLSIFVEKLIMYEINNDYYNDIKSMRLMMLKKALDRYFWVWDKACRLSFSEEVVFEYDSRAYIVSTLIADKLFYKYMHGSLETKGKMINDIQKVFDGKKTVEDFMSDYCVTYENSKRLRYIK